MPSGSLTIVGTGIQLGTHLTREARLRLETADVVLSLVAEPAMHAGLERLNPNTHSLHDYYELGENRSGAYEAMAEEILSHVREGKNVVAAVYGHPGVFVTPSHEAIRRARAEGYPATMLPGISAEDCLFADLGVDPARFGCQSYEATDFLVHRRRIDPTTTLVLWQIGTVGSVVAAATAQPTGLSVLVAVLLEHYPPEHEVTVYEASPYPGFDPLVRPVGLGELSAEHVTALSTLYVPPLEQAPPDLTMLARLGLPRPENL
jgi:uncharacterized protein YabN with tetrapyrrole methylase and pyrophosphatase domain